MKLILKQTVILVLLLWLVACSNGKSSVSSGTININGPGISGTVPAGATKLFTMQGITQGEAYTIQTTIPLMTLPDGSLVSDGTLTVTIYSSESAYSSNLPAEPIAVTPSIISPGTYEGYFTATSTGDYVAVLEGASSSIPSEQFFYGLRIMSAAPPYITSSLTPTILAQNYQVYPDYQVVYNGASVSPSGTYSLTLYSSVTATGAYPQLFVFNDATLETESLLYSATTTSYYFVVTDFTTNPPTTLPPDPNATLLTGVTIKGISFTSGGPYILVRGISTVLATYTMYVTP